MDPTTPRADTQAASRQAAREASPWTLRIATVAGVPIRVHATFLLLVLWVLWVASATGRPALVHLALVGGAFFCVVLHELGHVLVARHHGIGTRDITLYPIGGVSRLERQGDPRQELWISLAGPLVSLGLAAVLWAAVLALGRPVTIETLTAADPGWLELLAFVNTMLAVFNLVPAFPLDGGRILRAALSRRWGAARATRFAAVAGRVFAVILGVVGLFIGNVFLPIIAIFVFFGAKAEEQVQALVAATRGHTVADAMITRYEVLAEDDSLAAAAEHLLRTDQADYPVVSDGRVTGLLTRAGLLRAVMGSPRETPVGEVMEREFRTVAPTDDLESLLPRVLEARGEPALVMEGGRLLGLLTAENLTEFVLLAQAASMRAGPREA